MNFSLFKNVTYNLFAYKSYVIVACEVIKYKILVEKMKSHPCHQLTKFFTLPKMRALITANIVTPMLMSEFLVINMRTIFVIN